ncbi:tetracycline resistance MFS efflux pump [soil metagenome]
MSLPTDSERESSRKRSNVLVRTLTLVRRNETLFWVCLLIFVNQLGFGSIVPVVPLYADAFGVSATLIGATIAVYGAARFAMNVPTGYLADRFGRNKALALGGLLTVIGNLGSGFSDVYWEFLAGRFVAGAGAAMVITGTQIVVADISTRENRGRMMAVYQGVFLFAVGFGPLPGGLMADAFSLAAPFFAYAALGGVVSLLAWFRIPDTGAIGREAFAATGQTRPSLFGQLLALRRQTGFVLIAIVSFAAFFARTGGLFNLIPTQAENDLGLSASQIGLGLGVISLVGLALAYPSGALVDRFGRKTVIVPSTVVSGTSMFMFAVMPSFIWFLLACTAWAISIGISGPAPAAYAADMAPVGMNASAMGLYRMLADTGYILGPLMLGFAADLASPESALIATGVMVILTGIMFALLAPETRYEDAGGG